MLTYFCPNCWSILKERMGKCSSCGYALSDYTDLDYEGKLLLSLNHPVQDNRILAIKILGEINSQRALPMFAAILEKEDEDYYVLQAILQAAAKMDSPEGVALIEKSRQHPSTLVQNLANDLWAEIQEKGKT